MGKHMIAPQHYRRDQCFTRVWEKGATRKRRKPKLRYETKAEADFAAGWMSRKYHIHYHGYGCPVCGKYHVGRPPTKLKAWRYYDPTEEIELGERVLLHMRTGYSAKYLQQLFSVVERRLQNRDLPSTIENHERARKRYAAKALG